jgi:hypothetical protein
MVYGYLTISGVIRTYLVRGRLSPLLQIALCGNFGRMYQSKESCHRGGCHQVCTEALLRPGVTQSHGSL